MIRKFIPVLFSVMVFSGCFQSSDDEVPYYDPNGSGNDGSNDNTPTYADIDFTNWKQTLPVDADNNVRPDEYKPDQLINNGFKTLKSVILFMYDYTSETYLVFYTYPDATKPSSSYSRTELRELIN